MIRVVTTGNTLPLGCMKNSKPKGCPLLRAKGEKLDERLHFRLQKSTAHLKAADMNTFFERFSKKGCGDRLRLAEAAFHLASGDLDVIRAFARELDNNRQRHLAIKLLTCIEDKHMDDETRDLLGHLVRNRVDARIGTRAKTEIQIICALSAFYLQEGKYHEAFQQLMRIPEHMWTDRIDDLCERIHSARRPRINLRPVIEKLMAERKSEE